MTTNEPKSSNMKKTSLNLKKTTSFKISKHKTTHFTPARKNKKTTSFKLKSTKPLDDIPELTEEVPIGHLDELEEARAPVDYNDIPSSQNSELTESSIDVSMKNQNNEDIRPISINFATGPIIKKAVRITQTNLEPIKAEDLEKEPASSSETEVIPKTEFDGEQAPAKPDVKNILTTEILSPITASELEGQLHEEVATLQNQCAKLQQEKAEVANSAKQFSDYLKKDIEELKAINTELTQQKTQLSEKIVRLEGELQAHNDSTENGSTIAAESNTDSTDAKEMKEEFMTFVKLVDSLFERLPEKAIEEFVASDQCQFYKKVLTKYHK